MSAAADDAQGHDVDVPYRIALTRDGLDEERPWLATVEGLAGCDARGSTPTDAAARVSTALEEWAASARADGRDVPEPRFGRGHSGRLLLRMPQSLHAELAAAAERDQVSLNAYINLLLVAAFQSGAADWGGRQPAAPEPAAETGPGAIEEEEAFEASRLPRFLALALAANVAVVAIAALIAVVVLLTAD
jgi:antitoxin HicB